MAHMHIGYHLAIKKRRKSCHLQHRWNLRALCWVKCQTQTDKYCMIPLICGIQKSWNGNSVLLSLLCLFYSIYFFYFTISLLSTMVYIISIVALSYFHFLRRFLVYFLYLGILKSFIIILSLFLKCFLFLTNKIHSGW